MFLRMLKGQGRVDEVLDWALDGRTQLLVTCVGDPNPIAKRANEAGVKLYHQVGSLTDAQRAVDAGVDGLIVEGAESGGLRGVRSPHLFALLQQVRAKVDVPIIAAGGIADGHGMAGAFALGAEGILMGTRFMSSAESPVHANWKRAITDADVTLSIEPGMGPGIRMRVIGNELAESVFRGDLEVRSDNPYAGPFLEGFDHGRARRHAGRRRRVGVADRIGQDGARDHRRDRRRVLAGDRAARRARSTGRRSTRAEDTLRHHRRPPRSRRDGQPAWSCSSPLSTSSASSRAATSGEADIIGRRCSLFGSRPRRHIMYFTGIGLVS